jgi:vacuolar protein sorting-associated protein 45
MLHFQVLPQWAWNNPTPAIPPCFNHSTLLGMKALILDPVTTQIVSMVYSQTQILEQEVYLVELLGKKHEPMTHLKAAVFIQPTEANSQLLLAEFLNPKFSEYHLFFSNTVPADMLSLLARGDENDVVRQVNEYYADVLAINEDLFQLGVDNSLILSSGSARTPKANVIFERNVQGVLSVLLALKRRPSQIRYQERSESARRLATEVQGRIDRDDVFDFRRQEGPLLLVLDRKDDPVTPLLTQWTYQAMVHELLGLNNNRVVLRGAPNISKDLEEVVLSTTQDTFFARNRFSNFGDLGTAVKALLDDYQKKAKMNESISSIEDMQAFMERYPAFRSHGIVAAKHVAIMGELARLTDVCRLLDISQIEQDMACTNDRATHRRELFDKLSSPSVEAADKVRLALLYVLRYESYDETAQIKAKLVESGVSREKAAFVDAMLEYAGEARRAPGLYSTGDTLLSQFTKAVTTSVVGVENVYTQHVPVLSRILESMKGKIKDAQFPLVSGNSQNRPNEIIVFMIGGATYEEAAKVAEFNAQNPSMKVILGGSCIHNSASFLDELDASFGLGR